MKAKLFVLLGVVGCIAISILFAIVLATYVPKEHGVVKLEKDYGSYSNDELRDLLREHANPSGESLGFGDLIQGRGVIFQSLVWLFGMYVFRRKALSFLILSVIGISLIFAVGWINLNQISIFVSLLTSAYLFFKLGLNNSKNTSHP